MKNLLYFNFDKASEKTSLELEEAKEGFFFGLLFKTEYKQQPVYRKYMSVIDLQIHTTKRPFNRSKEFNKISLTLTIIQGIQ